MKNLVEVSFIVEKINSELEQHNWAIKNDEENLRSHISAKTGVVFLACRLLGCKKVGELKNFGVVGY